MISTTPYTKHTSLVKCNYISYDIKIAGKIQLNLPVSQKKKCLHLNDTGLVISRQVHTLREISFSRHIQQIKSVKKQTFKQRTEEMEAMIQPACFSLYRTVQMAAEPTH
jgi:hypothetical protein